MRTTGMNKKTMVIFYIVLIAIALVQLYPFFWVALSSFKPASDLARPAYMLPSEMYLGNYVKALSGRLPSYFFFPFRHDDSLFCLSDSDVSYV